ncbi:MAG: glycosyltransferase family 39 protein, partial [Planctomycetes bacterium]|nr:glycosyltransferase family 39 protein [Planctomycetota bacterium]
MTTSTINTAETLNSDLTETAARRWLTLVLAVALGVRLLVALGLGQCPPHIFDEKSYDEIAGSLATTSQFAEKSGRLTSLRPPLHPALLAGVYRCFGNHNYLAARLMQAILGMLTILPLYALAEAMFSRRVALLAAALFAIEPSLVGYTGLLLAETLFTLLLMLSCLLMQRLLTDGYFRWAVLLGMALGLAALTRSIMLPLVFPILLFLAWALRERKWPTRLALIATVGLACLAVVGPWIVRNTRLEGTLTTIDAIGGRNLMMGNYEHTPLTRSWHTISLHSGTDRSWEVVLQRASPEFARMTQGERDKLALRHGLKFILAHPGLSLERSCVKFFDFWQLERTLLGGLQRGWWGAHSKPTLVLVAVVTSGIQALLLLAAVFGIWTTRPRDMRMHWFIVLLIVLTATVHTIIFAHSRYRLPLLPLLL